jgi:hypothetical protein
MNAECAAYFVGVSLAKFRLGVKAGKYPASVKDGGNVLWRTKDLQACIDGERNPGQGRGKDYWLGKLGDGADHAAGPE